MSAVVDRALAESESLSQLASLVANLIITQSAYTDYFFLARRSQPMGLPAEMQWQLLPPRALSAPEVEISGQLIPAYEVGGDSFDYALNGTKLHVAIFDAVGHGPGIGNPGRRRCGCVPARAPRRYRPRGPVRPPR